MRYSQHPIEGLPNQGDLKYMSELEEDIEIMNQCARSVDHFMVKPQWYLCHICNTQARKPMSYMFDDD